MFRPDRGLYDIRKTRPNSDIGGGQTSDDLARDDDVLVERVDRTQAVVPVGNDDATIRGIAHEEERRHGVAGDNLLFVGFDVRVPQRKERQVAAG